MDIKNLFGINSQKEMPPENLMQESKKTEETYQQWGHRMAGRCDADVTSIDPHLQIVYSTIKKEQEGNAKLQEKLQRDISEKIAIKEVELEKEKTNLEQSQSASQKLKSKIEDITDKINQLKGQTKRKNSEAKVNLIIGTVILIPLTFYLFLFYSSTAYSAFFKEIDYTQGIGSHIFDSQALLLSWQQSWTAGLFVLLITFIFMALGYILHQFQQQSGFVKYIKVVLIIIITFVFDTLLAFAIAKNMYDAESLTILTERPSYSMSMAIVDMHFWVVIFCGFIAYIIWGLLFDLVMGSYNKLDLNKVERQGLEKQYDKLVKQGEAETKKQVAISNSIHAIEGNIAALKTKLSSVVIYDINALLLELNHFFSGWLHYMHAASKTTKDIEEAKSIFETFTAKIKSV